MQAAGGPEPPQSRITIGWIDSWSELAQLVDECAGDDWIFRGEPTVGNQLRPKAGRAGDYKDSARKYAYDQTHEVAALELFKRQARPYLSHNPATDVEWLAVAQHHGMSTRLLDWTESILVAAFFAVNHAGTLGDAVIYGLRDLPYTDKQEQESPFAVSRVSVYRPPHIAARIPAQRSVFTIHPDPTADFGNEVTQWVNRIKRILDACAINEASLFPDIDGLSRHIGWRYKWGKL
jgi:hypothetical protein